MRFIWLRLAVVFTFLLPHAANAEGWEYFNGRQQFGGEFQGAKIANKQGTRIEIKCYPNRRDPEGYSMSLSFFNMQASFSKQQLQENIYEKERRLYALRYLAVLDGAEKMVRFENAMPASIWVLPDNSITTEDAEEPELFWRLVRKTKEKFSIRLKNVDADFFVHGTNSVLDKSLAGCVQPPKRKTGFFR